MINKNKSRNTVCVLAELSQDEEERLLAESREKAYRDWQASMEGSFSDGKIEGKIESVIKLLSHMNLSVKEAMKIIELDDKYYNDVIKQLKKSNIKYTE